jgi:hypothetical protein
MQALATVFSDDLFFPSIFDFDRQLGRPSSGVPAQRGIAIDVVEVSSGSTHALVLLHDARLRKHPKTSAREEDVMSGIYLWCPSAVHVL